MTSLNPLRGLLSRYFFGCLVASSVSISVAIGASLSVYQVEAKADELESSLNKVKEMVGQKNFSAALDELGWARKEIEKMNSGQLGTFFPDDLLGFTGKKTAMNSAMGFTNIERDYFKGDTKVKISLTGGAGGGAGAGLGGLAAIGKMAAMFGGSAPGQETIRVQGRTAMLEAEQANPNLTIFLDSGPILKFEMTSGKEVSVLKDMAAAFKLDELEKYIKGGK